MHYTTLISPTLHYNCLLYTTMFFAALHCTTLHWNLLSQLHCRAFSCIAFSCIALHLGLLQPDDFPTTTVQQCTGQTIIIATQQMVVFGTRKYGELRWRSIRSCGELQPISLQDSPPPPSKKKLNKITTCSWSQRSRRLMSMFYSTKKNLFVNIYTQDKGTGSHIHRIVLNKTYIW